MKCKASRCTGQRIQTASVPDTMLTTGITALFSLTCALAVANVYSAQPLLDSMAVSLKAVSYTHLDVYKRQIFAVAC